MSQLTRLIAHEEGLTFQTEARLLHLRQQHRRVTETCLRLQIATASNTGQTERVDQRVARLESCRETARRCKRLFNRWQDLAGGIRVLVRIYSHPTRQPATNADANANGDADWTPGYTTGCLMVPSPDEVGVLSRTASSGDEAIGEERPNEAHSVRLFHVNEVLHSASPEADQLADLARRVAGHLSGGRSSAVICYGPRGTGKTHTCLYGAGRRLHDGLAGLVVQALLEAHQLHDFGWLIGAGGGATNGSWLAVSLLEVYNERVTCLLSGRDVQMRDDGRRMHVVGQLERPVRHVDNFVEVLRTAIAARRTACLAGQARHASRSHMIMMLRHRSEATSGWTSGWLNGGCVRSESRSGSNQSSRAYSQTVSDSAPSTRRGVDGPGQAIRHGNYEDYENCKEEEEEEEAEGTFILADLAGYTVSGLDAGEAELATSGSGSVGRRGGVKRPNRSFSCRGDSRGAEAKRLWRMEASEINRSLGAFRQVLHCLSSSERQVVAPFRNSRLTQLLKPCFAGDTQTTLVLNLTGDRRHQQATTHCLELGQVAMGLAFGHN
ncbi:unnamed protein product [Protopolystoma xenopodis]|uniref:Kinesin motor domain-containing protein n=1 Tax=Protopolystoma xenopodis TaxID=117903 RepID=A0A448WGN1_9PLAT|nr:unnamed protein product [Protopolystoma xenopodis]